MYKVTLINDGIETVIHHPAFNDLKITVGQIKTGINVSSSLNISLLPNNPGYNLIRPLKTLIEVQNLKTGKMEFEGRILMPTSTMNETGTFAKSFVCESELGYLNDSVQRYAYFGTNPTPGTVFERILRHHNEDVKDDEYDKTFRVGNVTVEDDTQSLDFYLEYDGTFDTIQTKLLDVLGGELQIRKENGIRYLDYLKTIGEVKTTEIRLAKNLKTIQQEVDPTAVITRLVPLGKERESKDNESDVNQPRVTISEVNDGLDYIEDTAAVAAFGIISKSQNWDDVEDPNRLKVLGRSFLVQNNRVRTKTTITALDLSLIDLDTDAFETGNYYPVVNSVMGINDSLRVVGKITDIINPNQNALTLGDTFKTASKYLSDVNKSQANIQALRNTIKRQNTQIGTISTELATTKENLSSTKEELEIYQQSTGVEITAVSKQITTVLEAVSNVEQAIANLEGIVSAEQIEAMELSIEENGNAIIETNNQLALTNEAIMKLTERVVALENPTPPEEGGSV